MINERLAARLTRGGLVHVAYTGPGGPAAEGTTYYRTPVDPTQPWTIGTQPSIHFDASGTKFNITGTVVQVFSGEWTPITDESIDRALEVLGVVEHDPLDEFMMREVEARSDTKAKKKGITQAEVEAQRVALDPIRSWCASFGQRVLPRYEGLHPTASSEACPLAALSVGGKHSFRVRVDGDGFDIGRDNESQTFKLDADNRYTNRAGEVYTLRDVQELIVAEFEKWRDEHDLRLRQGT